MSNLLSKLLLVLISLRKEYIVRTDNKASIEARLEENVFVLMQTFVS